MDFLYYNINTIYFLKNKKIQKELPRKLGFKYLWRKYHKLQELVRGQFVSGQLYFRNTEALL